MHASELKLSLLELKELFSAAGCSAAEKDLALLVEYLESRGDKEVDDVLDDIKRALDPAASKAANMAAHLARLKAAKLDEGQFKTALAALKADKALDKSDVLQLIREYGVIRINGKSRETYLESLDKHFYWLLYNRDADAMAKRATPW